MKNKTTTTYGPPMMNKYFLNIYNLIIITYYMPSPPPKDTLTSIMSPFINVTPSLISQKRYGKDVLSSNLPPCCHISFSYITSFTIKYSTKDFKPHACMHHVVIIVIYCHYCRLTFMLFCNITCCINSLLSRIHVNTANLLNITCTLVAVGVILGRLECSWE